MLDHPIVDVALGLILLYTVLSLFASVVKEWISTFLGLRAKNLEKGIQTLIGPDYASKLYRAPAGKHAGNREEAAVLHRLGNVCVGTRRPARPRRGGPIQCRYRGRRGTVDTQR